MLPLVVALVISVGPDNELNRTEILELMTTRPGGECGTGNPWVEFSSRGRAPETNALLMAMSSDPKLSAEQHSLALEALHGQKNDDTVIDFFRRRFAVSPPKSEDRRSTALFLLELSEADRALVLEQFDTGDLAFDRDVLRSLQFGPELAIPPATLARIAELYERAPREDDVVKLGQRDGDPFGSGWAAARRAMEQRAATAPLNKSELAAPLVRFAPEKYVPRVLRSKDPVQISHAYAHLDVATVDDLVEGLASADETMREQLDDALSRLIKSKLTVAERKALMNEVSSSKKRAGLGHIALAAYTLGTGAEAQRDFATAQKLYMRAAATPRLVAAVRAQRVGLLLKQKKTTDANSLSQGLMDVLRDDNDAFTVLDNDSIVDNSGLTSTIMKFDRVSAR